VDLYELLGEDKNAPEHKLARALRDGLSRLAEVSIVDRYA